jgi:hypothetical protein
MADQVPDIPRVKRKYTRRAAQNGSQPSSIAKPTLGLPDPLDAAREALTHAQEGALKLQKAVDTLRTTLETIVTAEMDNHTGLPVTALELRKLAVGGLDAYSAISGQSWRRHKLIGDRSGDRDLSTLEV